MFRYIASNIINCAFSDSEDLFSTINPQRLKHFHRMDEIHTGETICLSWIPTEKTFPKKKSWKKLWNSTIKFSQRRENIHCKIIHHKIIFFNNIFGHLALFIFWTDHTELDFGLIHGHAHSPSISFSFVVISLIIQLFISRHSVSE